MTTLTTFNREAAKRYLQSIVFVDDEIYTPETGEPVHITPDIAPLKSPFVGGVPEPDAPKLITPELNTPYHPRDLVESFAREGMVCALYEPRSGFQSGVSSEIFKLCERADVVILDWDLFFEDGKNILPLIANLIIQSQNSIPHHSRLCVIYTGKPDLHRVVNAMYEHLHTHSGIAVSVPGPFILTAGATRVAVWGKPKSVGRTAESQAMEVSENELAIRVIDEFAEMHKGLLASYALHGLASVRRNTKRILDKFNNGLDGVFLLHRAALLANEDAFEHIPELLAEEALAVMLDDQVTAEESGSIANEVASAINLRQLAWPGVSGWSLAQNQEVAKRFLGGGTAAIANEHEVKPISTKQFKQFHDAMDCGQTQSEKQLAALFNVRTRYVQKNPPHLELGTIVRWRQNESVSSSDYSLCLMPLCDSILRPYLAGKSMVFPFWQLSIVNAGQKGIGFVVQTGEDTYEHLIVSGKPREKLWLDNFTPGNSGTVNAFKENSSFCFVGTARRLEWVAQLKPAHAQRIALFIGQSFSRVGVFEAEWIRLMSESKDS